MGQGAPVKLTCDSDEVVLDDGAGCESAACKSHRDAFSPIVHDESGLLPFTCGPERRPVASHEVTKLQLIRASVDGNVPIIQAALKAGADIEVRHAKNFSHGHDLAKIGIVESHARTESRSPAYFAEEDSVLHQTLSNEPEETVEFVGGVFRLQARQVRSMKDGVRECGVTPLMLAARAGHVQAVMCLLQNHADPHAKDEHDMQPLHYAATAGCRECCKALLRAKASPLAWNDAGRDAFDCLPRGSMADDLDRMQWAALLRTQEFHRWWEDQAGRPPPMPQAVTDSHRRVPATRMRPRPRSDLEPEAGALSVPITAPSVKLQAKIARTADSADAAAGSVEGALDRVVRAVKNRKDLFPPDPGSVPVPRQFSSKETLENLYESCASVSSAHPGETAAVVARAAALQQQLAAAHESKLAGDEQLRLGNVAAADRCYGEATALLQHVSKVSENTTMASAELRQPSKDIFVEADPLAPNEKISSSDLAPGLPLSRQKSPSLLVCEEGSKDVAPL